MKKILIAGAAGCGTTLITKMLAKHLQIRDNIKILIQDLCEEGPILDQFKINELERDLSLTSVDDIDLTDKEEIESSYDLMITDMGLQANQKVIPRLDKYDEIILVIHEDRKKARIIQDFMAENALREVKLVVNLALLGRLDFSDDAIEYITFLSMDERVHALDRKGDYRGKILLKECPSILKNKLNSLAMKCIPKAKK